jgi:hypothetical protein
MKDSPENIAKAKYLLTEWCKDKGFKIDTEQSTNKITFWGGYLAKSVVFNVAIGQGGFSMCLIIAGKNMKIYQKSETLPWLAFDLDCPKLTLWSMMHDVVTKVFDEMLGLELNL